MSLEYVDSNQFPTGRIGNLMFIFGSKDVLRV